MFRVRFVCVSCAFRVFLCVCISIYLHSVYRFVKHIGYFNIYIYIYILHTYGVQCRVIY